LSLTAPSTAAKSRWESSPQIIGAVAASLAFLGLLIAGIRHFKSPGEQGQRRYEKARQPPPAGSPDQMGWREGAPEAVRKDEGTAGDRLGGEKQSAAEANGDIWGTAAKEDVHDVDPAEFERNCVEILQRYCWATEVKSRKSGEILIAASRLGLALSLRCIPTSSAIGIGRVQAAITAAAETPLNAIVSNAPFTRAAQQLASAHAVRTLQPEELAQIA
jgi:hypothetical protein